MKHLALLLFSSTLMACGDDLRACGHTYGTVGAITDDDMVPGVEYRLIPGNIVLSIFLFETLAAPIYFIGFSMWEPWSADCDRIQRREK